MPALVTVLPHQQKGKTVVLDLGPTSIVTARWCNLPLWAQFWLKRWWKIANPRVALFNIGEEEVKGLDSIRDASAVLKTDSFYQLYRLF
ncbi:hypothetical protein ACVXHA_29735 [Escherichia coli]